MALSRGPERQLIDPKKTYHDLVSAVRSNNVDAVRELLNKHDKGEISFEPVDNLGGRTVLHVAASMGNPDILTLLLDAAPPNTVDMRDDYGDGETALCIAVRKNHADICKQLIKAGADVNQKLNDESVSLLYMAIKRKHTEVVRVLLRYNAKTCTQDKYGDTPLHLAIRLNLTEVVRVLPWYKADLCTQNQDGNTPLHLAAGIGNEILRSVLCHEGFCKDHNSYPLHVKNNKRHMPLHVAVSACNVESVQRILWEYAFFNREEMWEDFIVKRSVLPEKGCVMDMAIDSGNEEIVALLINDPHWESFLLVKYEKDEQRCTPMRKLIHSMPQLASIVMNNCWKPKYEEGKHLRTPMRSWKPNEEHYITADYQLVDDTFCSWDPNQQNTLFANNGKCKPYSEDKSLLRNNHPLQMIVDTNATQLIDNPLVQSLLRRKWKLAAVFYFSFLLYYLTYLALITTLMFKSTPPFGQQTCENMSSSDRIEVPLANMALRGAVYVFAVFGIVLEITQFVLVRFKRYIAFHNIADWFSYVCPFVVFGTSSICGERTDWQWQLGVACLFVSYINILFYLRIVPVLGIYIMMVTLMLWNFLRFFVIMFLFLLSFGICFNLLLQNQVSFTNVGFSVIKNYNMMLGEIDFAGIFLDHLESDDDDDALHYAVMVWFLYVAFLVLMVLVMMNLLTSLAVSGVASLEKDSKHKMLSQQINLSLYLEIALPTFLRIKFQDVVNTETFDVHKIMKAQNNNPRVERLIGCMESFFYGNLNKKEIIAQARKNVKTASVAAHKPQAPEPLTIKDVDNCIERQTRPLIKNVNDIDKSMRERIDNNNKKLDDVTDLLTKRVDSIDMKLKRVDSIDTKLEQITELLTKISIGGQPTESPQKSST